VPITSLNTVREQHSRKLLHVLIGSIPKTTPGGATHLEMGWFNPRALVRQVKLIVEQ